MNDRDAERLQRGEGGRAGQMTSDDPARRFEQRDNGAVRFAPNFSVYVLPPDVVCLYSEDRKFFLHGELYCALATAIGAGKSVGEIVRVLGKKFPSDKIHEALKRLLDRRYVGPKRRSSADDAPAAYWASLGMPPGIAEQNLRKCRVRIQSIDVKGGNELG